MASTEQRRQKKLAKKRAKERAKRKEIARQQNAMQSTAGQIQAAAGGEIRHCLVGETLFEEATEIGMVLISRQMPDRRIACVYFLVDMLCLGVKDHHVVVGYPSDIREYVERIQAKQLMQPSSPARARKLVESSIAYAERYGLSPAAGYQKLAPIWGDIDPAECDEEFAFGGPGGKPRYVNGPHDTPAFQRQVLDTLERNAGEGNYDIVFMGSRGLASATAIEPTERLEQDSPDVAYLQE